MSRSTLDRVILIGLVLLVPSPAQVNTGSILGVVTDQTGAVIAGALVTARNELTGFSRSVATDATGSYLLPLLPISEQYRLTAEAAGFRSYVGTGIGLALGQNARVDIQLPLGSVAESVEVMATAPLVDTRSAAGGEVVERKRILELPLNGRNPLQLATLLPGVSVASIRTTIDGGNRSGNYLDVSGSRNNEIDWQLDGVHFGGSYTNSGMNMPAPDALEEFRLVTNSYSAEFGVFAGAVFRSVVRSGTNQVHGAAWEFLRNNQLNARSYFLPTVNPLKQNQFGASIGFPIRKNRLFMFSSYQGLKIRTSAVARHLTLLNANERAGVFASTVRDPLTGQPFPNNTVPASRISTPAKRFLDFVPEAPASGALFVERSRPVDTDQWIGKVDYLASAKDTVNVTFVFDRTRLSNPFPVAQFLSFPANTEDQVVPLLSFSHTHTFTPALINEVRFGLSSQEETRQCPPMITPRELGMNMDLTPIGTPVPPAAIVTGRFSINSGTNCNWTEGGQAWQITEQASWIRGRHQWKFGGEYFFRNSYSKHLWQDSGVINFGGQVTGNAAADYLLGDITTIERRARGDRLAVSKSSFFYVQDDFKISRRLTLNLGVRWEILGPYGEVRGPERSDIGMPQMATIRYGEQSQVIPVAPPGLLFAGDKTADWPDGLNNSQIKLDWSQIQPRVGFAWDVFGDGRTSVRSSFGLYSNSMFGDMIQRDANAPFRIGQILTRPAGGFEDPWLGLVNPFPVELDLSDPAKMRNYFPLPLIGFAADPFYRFPRVMSMTFNVQRQILPALAVEAGYVSKLSRHLNDTRDINTAAYIPGVGANGAPLSTLANLDARRRLFPNIYSRLNLQDSNATAAYHSMQSAVRYRGGALTVVGAYTWSKSLDNRSTIDIQGRHHQDSENTALDRGPSDFDRRHVGTVSWVYELPALLKHRGIAGRLLDGWEVSGVLSASTGAPFTVTSGRDNSLTGNGYDRPDHVGNPLLPSDRSRNEQIARYFNTAAFRANQTGQFGNVGRNTLYGPGRWNTDLGLFKNFLIREPMKLQFRGELFNAFNQVTLNNPVSLLTSPVFGQITDSGAARIVQFGLKLSW